MSILRDIVGAVCCCLPDKADLDRAGLSRDLKRLSDWRAHPTLRQYDLEKHIADGGFSEVWLARCRSTGEEHCLKVVNLRKPGLLPGDIEILRGEARFLRLLDHPGLLHCRDTFETKYHMVMNLEYLSGGQMLDHLHRVEHYSEAQAARLFAQVAAAVAYMHTFNIVHRDIKPENVMFARPVEDYVAQGRPLRVKLIDLGMATVLLPPPATSTKAAAAAARARKRRRWHDEPPLPPPRIHQEAPRGCMGSPGFIAPEIVKGGRHTLSMDVYALGVLLFAMLTGRKPFSLRDSRNLSYAEHSIKEAPGLSDAIFLSLSSSARELLLAMLADDPRDRPSCAEVLRHPFMTQSLATGPEALLRQPPLDSAIKRRIAQLASLRRFRGLAFAMMTSRQEGQDLRDFTKQLTERRRALHRDLIIRAKTRHSLDLQRDGRREEQELEQQQTEQELERKNRSVGKELRVQTRNVAAAANALPLERRRSSIDSACSRQPLLRHQSQHQNQQRQQCSDARQSMTLTVDCNGDASNNEKHPHQQQHQANPHRHPNVRRSPDSLTSTASSRQPLNWACGDGGGGGGPLLGHHVSHPVLTWLMGNNGSGSQTGDCGAAFSQAGLESSVAAGAAGDAGGGGSGHANTAASSHQLHRRSNSYHLRYPMLDTVAEPEDGLGRAGAALPVAAAVRATVLLPTTAQVEAGGATNAGRGWSSSGRQPEGAAAATAKPAAAAAPQQQQHPTTRSRPPVIARPELELLALEPLGLIRELPAYVGSPLGKAHSAPESQAAALLPMLSSSCGSNGGGGGGGGGGRLGGDAGARAAGSGGGGDGAATAADAADGWLDRVAMGADMRALSANSWTLDLLENADLLAALTGVRLAYQVSSTLDTTLHGGATPYNGTLAAVLSAATRTSGDGAAAAAMLQRLRSDVSGGGGGGGGGPALVRHPSSSSRGSSARHNVWAMAAAAAATSTGRQSKEGWQMRSSFWGSSAATAAAAAVAADTPTRPMGVYGGGIAATATAAAAPSPEQEMPTTITAVGQFYVKRPFVGNLELRRVALLDRGSTPPPTRPSLEGSAALLTPPQPLQLQLSPGVKDSVAESLSGGSGADAEQPLPLLVVRHGHGDDAGGVGSRPLCDVPYTSLHLSLSSRQLGVALAAAGSPAAAAADATVTAAPATAGAISPISLAALTTALEPPSARLPSLALVDMDEQIAAQWASLEKTLHGGNAWFQIVSEAGPVAALAAAVAAAAGGDSSSRILDSRLGTVGYGHGHFTPADALLTTVGSSSSNMVLNLGRGQPGPGSGSAQPLHQHHHYEAAATMRSAPSLERITECSDLVGPNMLGVETDSGSAAAAAAPVATAIRTRNASLHPLPPVGAAAPQPRYAAAAAATTQQPSSRLPITPGGGSGSAAAAAAVLVGKATGAVPSAAGAGAQAVVRWRSPFEALAVAALAPDLGTAEKLLLDASP